MLTPAFSLAGVGKHIQQFADARVNEEIERLQFIGEEFVNAAKVNGNYTDRTGNLRSSIGYVVLYLGAVKGRKVIGGKSQGSSRAKELIDQFKLTNPNELVLIGFAGMEYAAAVESKGFDVITGSVPVATELLNILRGG